MEKKQITIPLEIYNSADQLPKDIQLLMNKAQEAREKAYAPYSRFRVGAAVLLENNEIILGNNQENAAFPSGLCAERVAIFSAGANYPNHKFKAIAISARSEERILAEPIAPCGSCRQSMAEYEQKQKSPIAVYFMGEEGVVYKVDAIADLLPFGFSAEYL